MSNVAIEFLNLVITGGIGILLIVGFLIPPPRRLTKEEKLQKKIKQQGGMIISLQNQNASLSASSGTRDREYQRRIAELQRHHAEEIDQLQKKRHPPF